MNKKPSSSMGEPSKRVITIYLIRHGETALNAEQKLRGWVDVPLNKQGKQEALDVAAHMQDVCLDRMYVSDLKRAKQTAKAVELWQDKPNVIVTPNLRPLNFGDWNGKLLSEVEPKMLALQKKWETDPEIKAPKGESWRDYALRQESIAQRIITNDKPGDHVAIVAHLRNCVWFLAYALNNGIWVDGESIDLTNRVTQQVGRVSVLTWCPEDGWKILAMNTRSPETEDISSKAHALEKQPKS